MEEFITTIIAILLAYIAFQNYRINQSNSHVQKDKLRLDLFDRRLKIFKAAQELFSIVMRDAVIKTENLYKFLADSSDSEFLFGDEIKKYLSDVYKKACHLNYLREMLGDSSLGIGEKRIKFAQENSELLQWFGDQFGVSKNLFRKYLHFTIYK